jgi:hypothetical protein
MQRGAHYVFVVHRAEKSEYKHSQVTPLEFETSEGTHPQSLKPDLVDEWGQNVQMESLLNCTG